MEKNVYEQLIAPFPSKDIEWRVGNVNKAKMEGLALPYVTNRAIMERLDKVFGPLRWQNQFIPWRDNSQLCGISAQDEDSGEWITKWDGADNTNFESTKGGLSDSMKRAAVQWGIGRYLYTLESVWAKVETRGKTFVFAKGTQFLLPAWAVPEEEVTDRTPKDKIIVVYNGYNQPQQQPQQSAQQQGQQNAQNRGQQRPPQNAQQGAQNRGQQQAQRMTRRHYDTIMNTARAAEISNEDVLKWIRKQFGLNNIYDLNPQQYQELLVALENAARNNSPAADSQLPWENPDYEYMNG